MTMPSLHIAGRRVSGEDPCFVIAEIGINHNGSLEMALKLVDAVVDAKADAVKFQKRNIKSLYPKKLLDDPNTAEWAFQYMLPILKEMELTPDEFRRIATSAAFFSCAHLGMRKASSFWKSSTFLPTKSLRPTSPTRRC